MGLLYFLFFSDYKQEYPFFVRDMAAFPVTVTTHIRSGKQVKQLNFSHTLVITNIGKIM
jgi:hypothetical protein